MEYNTVEYMYDIDDDCLGISIVRHKLYYNTITTNRDNYVDVNDSGIIESIDIKDASICFGMDYELFDNIDDIEVLAYAISDDMIIMDITLKVMGRMFEMRDYIPCDGRISNKSICYTMV